MEPVTVATAITAFLADLEQAGRSPHTRRAYASELTQLLAAVPPTLPELPRRSQDLLRHSG